MGAWIETYCLRLTVMHVGLSHPTWVRGLKQLQEGYGYIHTPVAPYVGAWIETSPSEDARSQLPVAPYVGAWIETSVISACSSPSAVAPYVGAWIETF